MNNKSLQFSTTPEAVNFYSSRKAFIILDKFLLIEKERYSFSHLKWLLELGFSEKDADFIIANNARGYFKTEHGLYFYKGYDYEIDSHAEKQFFKFLPEIVERMELLPINPKVYGGAIPNHEKVEWSPRKEYGSLSDLLNSEKSNFKK